MNKRVFFHMYLGAVKLTLLLFVIAGALAVIGLDIAILAGAIATDAPAVAWVSLAAAVLVLAATLVILLGSGYRFDDRELCVLLGFFKDKLPYSNITGLKRNGESGVYYVVSGDMTSGTSVRIDIARGESDKFVEELRKHVPTVPVETFDIPKKDKEKDK